MARNSWLKTFADEKVGVNGCLYKAGFTELSDTLEGYGRGYDGVEWFTGVGSMSVANGGIVSSVNGYIKVTVPNGTGSDRADVIRQALVARGSVQFDIRAADICDPTNLTSNQEIIRSYLTSGNSNQNPLSIKTQTTVLGFNAFHATAYDGNGNPTLTNPVYAVSHSKVTTYGVQNGLIFHEELANTDGYITVGISWTGSDMRYYFNGYLVAIESREQFLSDEFNYLRFMGNNTTTASIKNFLLYDRPLPRLNPTVDIRVAVVGHSFVAKQNLGVNYHDNGATGGRVGNGLAASSTNCLQTAIQKRLNAETDMYSMAFSGENLGKIRDRIKGNIATTLSRGDDFTKPVDVFRPDFCVIHASLANDANVASLTQRTACYDISKYLMERGVIPVWLVEYNTEHSDFTNTHSYVMAELGVQQSENDIGVVDTWDFFGSGNADRSYIAYEDNSGSQIFLHPNFKGQDKFGELCSVEINRLIANPPNYSRLAGGNGEHEAMTVPS